MSADDDSRLCRHDISRSSEIQANHGQPAGHRFHHHETAAVMQAGEQHQIVAVEEIEQLLLRKSRNEIHVILEAKRLYLSAKPDALRAISYDREPRLRSVFN